MARFGSQFKSLYGLTWSEWIKSGRKLSVTNSNLENDLRAANADRKHLAAQLAASETMNAELNTKLRDALDKIEVLEAKHGGKSGE